MGKNLQDSGPPGAVFDSAPLIVPSNQVHPILMLHSICTRRLEVPSSQ